MRKAVIISGVIILIVLINVASLWAGEINFNSEKAKIYAKDHCSTSTYNHAEYKCWNGDLKECVNNGSGRHVDCANFVSQALIEGFGGGNPFACVKNSNTIGKDGFTKGEISVSQLKTALTDNFCFRRIPASEAKEGDILSWTNGSHITIAGGNNT